MPHPDEGLIHAWLDGELDAAESARIEALVASDPAWAAAAAEARGLIAAASRIVRALDHVPAGVVPRTTSPAIRRAPRWWMARVAALLVVVAGASVVWRRNEPSSVMKDSAREDAPTTVQATAPSAMATIPAAKAKAVPGPAAQSSPPTKISLAPAAASSAANQPAAIPLAMVPPAAPAAAARAGTVDQIVPPPAALPSAVLALAGAAAMESRAKAAEKRKDEVSASQLAGVRVTDAAARAVGGAAAPTVSCFVVRGPVKLAGRTVTNPPDSLSRMLWASAGLRAELLYVRGDSLHASVLDTAEVIAVRTRCPR
jgi:hypothetical protein